MPLYFLRDPIDRNCLYKSKLLQNASVTYARQIRLLFGAPKKSQNIFGETRQNRGINLSFFSLNFHFCTTLSNERDPSSQAHCINDRDTFSKFIWRLSKIDDFCCFTERCLTYFPSLFFLSFHFSTTLSNILALVI